MTIIEFYDKYRNKFLDYDGVYGNQCTDLIKAYCSEVLNVPVFKGNAIDYWHGNPQGLTKTQTPKPGDIVVFNIGEFGHIAIVNYLRQADFGVFEQNSPVGSPCHFTDYPNFNHVLGYLTPTNLLPEAPRPQPQEFTMQYTTFNTDLSLLMEARQILKEYSGGKLDAVFLAKQVPIVFSDTELISQEQQQSFLTQNSVTTPFAFLTYQSQSNFINMVTNEVPGTKTILTCANPGGTALGVCFEFSHAICKYLQDQGKAIDDTDIYTPTPEFLHAKIDDIVHKLFA